MPRRLLPSRPDADAGHLSGWKLVCLCAAWCRTCEAYEAVMQSAADAWPRLACHWVDIEDDAALLGDLDIETFPTLLLADDEGALRFSGVLQPHAGVLQRLLQQAPDLPPLDPGGESDALSVVQSLAQC